MPRPAAALAAWTAALRPGGVLTVCFWPKKVEKKGPWQRLVDLTAPSPAADGDWEAGLLEGAAAAGGGAVLQDLRIPHDMSWPDAEAFWEAMTRAGPWHARRLQHGDAHMEELRARFLGGGWAAERRRRPLRHTPSARLVVLRRGRGAAL